MDQATVAVVRRAFESAGVEFLEENGGTQSTSPLHEIGASNP
jgi:hypothetical protein